MSEPAHQIPLPERTDASPFRRRRPLPATALPASREDRRGWGLLSTLLHVLIALLIAMPVASHTGEVREMEMGAGGPGPVGGGGGGRRGTGGVRERIQFVEVAPAPPPPAVKAVVPPPVVPPPPKPEPKPVVPPPEVLKTPDLPDLATIDPKVQAPKAEATAATVGTGGGSGTDGSKGNGPGSGGGVGSGIGTGRGSATGPGTGGGSQVNYPPTPTELFIPPLPIPDKVRGFHLVAEYDVDATGKVVDFKFTPTRDNGYNRRLEEVLRNFKFRPGTTPDGTPVRMKAQIVYDF